MRKYAETTGAEIMEMAFMDDLTKRKKRTSMRYHSTRLTEEHPTDRICADLVCFAPFLCHLRQQSGKSNRNVHYSQLIIALFCSSAIFLTA